MARPEPISDDQVRIVPANEAEWEDLQAVLGTRDYAARCQCQRLRVAGWIWRDSTLAQRTDALRAQTACGTPDAPATSGIAPTSTGSPRAGPPSHPGSRTRSCGPAAFRGAGAARTATIPACGR